MAYVFLLIQVLRKNTIKLKLFYKEIIHWTGVIIYMDFKWMLLLMWLLLMLMNLGSIEQEIIIQWISPYSLMSYL